VRPRVEALNKKKANQKARVIMKGTCSSYRAFVSGAQVGAGGRVVCCVTR